MPSSLTLQGVILALQLLTMTTDVLSKPTQDKVFLGLGVLQFYFLVSEYMSDIDTAAMSSQYLHQQGRLKYAVA